MNPAMIIQNALEEGVSLVVYTFPFQSDPTGKAD